MWELLYYNNYAIPTKGGEVDGYSAKIGFVPELKFGNNNASFPFFTVVWVIFVLRK